MEADISENWITVMRKMHYYIWYLCKVHINERYMHLEFGENVLTLANP